MQPLSDPNNDRAIKTVRPPPHRPLDKNLFFPPGLKGIYNNFWFSYKIFLFLGKPDWKLVRDHLAKEGRIWKEDFIKLINDANKVFSKN